MKLPSIIRRKKLHASTARRSRALGLPSDMNYEQMAEPNMKLSRALLIVLVLHIVAVAGIIAFNTIKTREMITAPPPEALAPTTPTLPAPGETQAQVAPPNEVTQATSPSEKKGPEKISADAKPVIKTPAIPDSGKTYTVVKGDNPVTIARHLKVSEADLLALNKITDPRKLQIGQKLRIPEREAAKRRPE